MAARRRCALSVAILALLGLCNLQRAFMPSPGGSRAQSPRSIEQHHGAQKIAAEASTGLFDAGIMAAMPEVPHHARHWLAPLITAPAPSFLVRTSPRRSSLLSLAAARIDLDAWSEASSAIEEYDNPYALVDEEEDEERDMGSHRDWKSGEGFGVVLEGGKAPFIHMKKVQQRKAFYKLIERGAYVSEVFARVPGKTPWKFIGEVANLRGDYEMAVRVQWHLLVEHTHFLYPKFRFLLPKETLIQLGYTNETAQIVPIEQGWMPEATEAPDMMQAFKESGFQLGNKEWRWRTWQERQRWFNMSSHKDHHIHKPHLLRRHTNRDMKWMKWQRKGRYNQDKFPTQHYARFFSGKKKRGNIPVGTSARSKRW